MLGAQRHDGRRPLCYSISATLTPTLADMCLSTLYPHLQSAQSPQTPYSAPQPSPGQYVEHAAYMLREGRTEQKAKNKG